MVKSFSFFSKIVALVVMMLNFVNIATGQEKGYLLDLDKLVLFEVYQKDSIIAKLGKPDSYSNYMTEFGLSEEYIFGESTLIFNKNGVFSEFILKDTRFVIYSRYISAGIRVGDSVNKFQQLGFGRIEIEDKETYLFYDNPKCALPLIINHINGIIIRILLY